MKLERTAAGVWFVSVVAGATALALRKSRCNVARWSPTKSREFNVVFALRKSRCSQAAEAGRTVNANNNELK
ncbi:MAG: hypothetical protein KDA51_19995, partial [Planctomycetales bacterium]|nr:hypothetical protein [Planctomycetales bacterium]